MAEYLVPVIAIAVAMATVLFSSTGSATHLNVARSPSNASPSLRATADAPAEASRNGDNRLTDQELSSRVMRGFVTALDQAGAA